MCDVGKKNEQVDIFVLQSEDGQLQGSDTSDILFVLPRPVNDVTEISLLQAALPMGISYNISSRIGNNVFQFTVGVTTYTATIVPGNYDNITLETAIEQAMTAQLANAWDVVLSTVTGFVTFAGTSAFELNLANYPKFAKVIGFPASTSSSGVLLTGPYRFNLLTPLNVYMDINNLPSFVKTTMSQQPYASTFEMSSLSNNGDLAQFTEGSIYRQIIKLDNQTNFTGFRVRLWDRYGLLDLGRLDWVIKLRVVSSK